MSINIISQNIRGLNVKEKLNCFEEQARKLQSQFILLQEHMLTNNKKLSFEKYVVKQQNRNNNEKGGGTAIAVDTERICCENDFRIESIDLDVNLLEATSLAIHYKNLYKPILLISTYLSPDTKNWLNKLNELKVNLKKFKFWENHRMD